MRALTVSEINKILIEKGYNKSLIIKNIPQNKWEGNVISFDEYDDGKSYCSLYEFIQKDDLPKGCGSLILKANYSKLKAQDKKEFQKLIENLPNINNKAS